MTVGYFGNGTLNYFKFGQWWPVGSPALPYTGGLAAWWDASDTATITESGGAVSQVDDKSGNGRHLIQPTAARQPTTGVNSVNGRNVLSYDGGDDLYSTASFALVPFTMIAVFQHVSQDYTILSTGPSANVPFFGAAQDGSTSTQLDNPANATLRRNNGAVISPANRNALYDELAGKLNLVTYQAGGQSGSYQYAPLSYPNNTSFSPVLYFCEVLLYASTLTGNEISQVESYLAAKWGVTLA